MGRLPGKRIGIEIASEEIEVTFIVDMIRNLRSRRIVAVVFICGSNRFRQVLRPAFKRSVFGHVIQRSLDGLINGFRIFLVGVVTGQVNV